MTNANDAIPTKRGPGRPRKISPDIAAMQAQIAALEARLATAESADSRPNYDPAPPASEQLRPGTYVVVGKDNFGKDVYAKVRWTKEAIEQVYAPVTFTPRRNMTVAPHGVSFTLTEETETTVPSIVKDIYDGVVKEERDQAKRYRPQTAQEIAEIDARAAAEPGSKQWSRLSRMGYGLSIASNDTEGLDLTAAPLV